MVFLLYKKSTTLFYGKSNGVKKSIWVLPALISSMVKNFDLLRNPFHF